VKILIVEDHFLYREGLVNLLSKEPSLSIVGEAGSVREAIDKSLELNPDLVLMDISLPDGSGVDAASTILSRKPETLIVMLTGFETDELFFASIRNGAVGYLLKHSSATELIQSLKAIKRGEAALTRAMTLKVLEEFHRIGRMHEPLETDLSILTKRELQVLNLLASGPTNLEIAAQLMIAENTAKIYVHNILKKLKLRNRREAGEFARRHRLYPSVFNHQNPNSSL
jgi:two-component system, NarL family, response regulator DevR